MEPESPATQAWPQPHPSPPPPPPRAYGSPGSSPDRSWIWLGLGGVVVLALTVLGGARLLGGAGAGADDAAASAATAPAEADSSPVASAAGPSSAIRCWDGTGEQAVDDCSFPDGAAGLAWVFPHLAEQRCGQPTRTGPGVVLRILCSARMSDGSRVQLGYYQWESVEAGTAVYDAQGLQSTEANGFLSWTGREGDTLKSVLLYADAPFSQTVTLPNDVVAGEDDLAMLQPRPPGHLRGEPVG